MESKISMKYLKKEFIDFLNNWNDLVKKHPKVFKIFPHNILLFIIYMLILFSGLSFITHNSTKLIYEDSDASITNNPLIVDEQRYNLNNINLDRNINEMCLKFNTNNRINQANYEFIIYHKNDIINSVIFDSSTIKDKEYYCFNNLDINYKKLSDYDVAIKPLYANIDNYISLYSNQANLTIKLINNNSYNIIYIIIYLTILLAINLLSLINNKRSSK